MTRQVKGQVVGAPARGRAVQVPVLAAAGVLLLTAATHTVDPGDDAPLRARFRRPAAVPGAAANAPTPARIALGKSLFFDPRLSRSKLVSCASCHNPSLSWGDGNALAVGDGMKTLGRRTPTILNAAWSSAQFWDGRAETLEEQALGPIQAEGEMNLSLAEMMARLEAIEPYRRMVADAYPGEAMSPQVIAKALAVFERTVVSGTAPFDRWVNGDEQAISESAKAGFRLFNGKANCAACHSGWRFTDDSFQDIGLATADSGRARVLPGVEGTQFAFKTPTLRNVAERYPYMHDGSEATLEQVIELYDAGGRVRRPSVSPEVRPLHLTPAEKRALLAFLRTLSSADAPVTLPVLPR